MKRIYLCFAVLFLFFLFFSCHRYVPLHPKLALVVPLSGKLAPWGKRCEQGVKLRLKSEKGIKLEIFDNQGKPSKTKEIFASLAEDPDVIGIIGPLKCSCLQAVLPIIKDKELPTICLGCFSDLRKQTDGFALPLMTQSDELQAMAAFLNKRGASWALVYTNEPWSEYFAKGLKKLVQISPIVQLKLKEDFISPKSFQVQRVQVAVLLIPPSRLGFEIQNLQKMNPNILILGRFYLFDNDLRPLILYPDKVFAIIPCLPHQMDSLFKEQFVKTYYHLPHWLSACSYGVTDALLKMKRLSRWKIKKDFSYSLNLKLKAVCVNKE